jgi:hypothetical protein
LDRWRRAKRQERAYTYLIQMIFILEIGWITGWTDMAPTFSFRVKSIRGSLEKGSNRVMESVSMRTVSSMKVLG